MEAYYLDIHKASINWDINHMYFLLTPNEDTSLW